MKHSKTTKAMALMLSLVMITSVFVGNTLSRYVTSVSSTDSARVAVWGINGEETQMNLFDTKYLVDEKVVAEANNETDKIIAPGTKGEAEFNIINFEQDVAPEVAYEVKISLDDSAIDDLIKNNPSIQWKLDNGSFGTWNELKTAVLSLSGNETGKHVYAPGQFATAFQGTQTHTIYWQWVLDNNENVTTEVCDGEGNCQNVTMTSQEYNTYLGNLALDGDISAVIKVGITATQVDDLVTNGYILDGANQTINIAEVEPLTIRSSADFSTFESVEVNGAPLTKDTDYTVSEGSTVVTLTKEYLSNLAVGTYNIDIISTDVIASTKFNVVKDNIIRIESEEEVHALSRVLVSDKVYAYKLKPFSYNIEDDFTLLGVPETLETKEEKMNYLQTASYKLMNDVSIEFKYEKGLDYFLGIGSLDYPFSGSFDGNNKIITLSSPSNITLADATVNLDYGFFAVTNEANINNVNIEINDDIIIDRVQQKYGISFAPLVGYSKSSNYDNCNVKITNANFGVDYGDGEGIEYISFSNVGGLVGQSKGQSTYNNCHVELIDSGIIAKAKDIPLPGSYGVFAVGGLIGMVGAGSNNTAADIGVLGNSIYNCSVTSNNSTLRDVILAEVESGDEMTAGGLVGIAYNNALISGSSVNIINGNIIGQKTGNVRTETTSGLGSTVGGIIGRMEHTGEIIDCTVTGNNLHILAKSPHRVSWAGGIVGESIGAHHRNTIDVVNCHFDGSGNSTIEVNVAIPDETINNDAFAGGIAGSARRIEESTVKNVTIINNSTSSGTKLIGNIVGKILEVGGAYEEREPKGIYNSSFSNVILEKGENVINNNYEIN